MHITTHKGTDFDAPASVVAANLLYPGIVTVLPGSLNPNVRAFLSLHKDLFDFCTPEKISFDKVCKLIVVDTNRWDRLDLSNNIIVLLPFRYPTIVDTAYFDCYVD